MTDLTKMKWPQCLFKKKSRSDKKNDTERNNDSEDDIDTCDEKQLDDLLYKFSEEIFYDEENKEKLLKMDVCQKRILIRSSRQKFQSSFDLLEVILEKLRRLNEEQEGEDQETEKLFDHLSAALRTESLRYVRHFMEANGLGLIFVYMRDCAIHALNSQIFSQCIRCIRSLGNSENGYDYLLAFNPSDECTDNDPGLIEVIGKGLWSKVGVTVSMICELFGALCFTEDGWLRVMKALLFLSRNDVHHRFDILVQQFLFQENLDVKCAVLSLINALAEFVKNQENSVSNRIHLRYQTVKCGLTTFITPFRDCSHSGLRKQIEVFIQHQQEDIDFLRGRGRLSLANYFLDKSVNNWDDLEDFIGQIRSSLSCTDAQIHLTSLLHHLLLLPLKKDSGFLYLQMIDAMVQQISIQKSDTTHPDPALSDLQINIDELLTRLATDNDLKNKQMEVDHLVMEHKSLSGKVLDLENQCFTMESEKAVVDLRVHDGHAHDKNKLEELNRSNAELLTTSSAHCDNLASENAMLQKEVTLLRQKLEQLKLTGAAPPSSGDSSVPNVIVHPPPPPPPCAPAPPPPAPPAPPPPPPPFAFPPSLSQGSLPAPPPAPPIRAQANAVAQTPPPPTKPIPKVAPLKCLNWTKVPQAKLTNSMWSSVNEDDLYSLLDLDTLQSQFSTAVAPDPIAKPLATPTLIHKSLSISTNPANVISNQRSQNLFIKLKPARMTWAKWQKHLYDCNVSSNDNEDESFPHQLAEGILSLYPTLEEIELLEDAVSNHGQDNLPEAETFMFECYKFPHYMERLSSLIFLSKAPKQIKRLAMELTITQSAINTVMNNTLLPKLFEIILAIGNVMNQKRGIAYGFKVESLNQLKKLKCSQSGADGVTNLLQFVIMMAEKHNATVLDLPKQLECVQSMAKVNVGSIAKEVNELSCGLQKLSNAIDLIRRSSREPSEEDRFLEVAMSLQSVLTKEFTQLNQQHKIVCSDIEKCHQFFGENPPSTSASSESEDSTQKLFADLALFLQDMDLTWRSMVNDREKKVMLEHKKSILKSNGPKPNIAGKKGELDVNISRLLSGVAFKENRLFMSRQNQIESRDLDTS